MMTLSPEQAARRRMYRRRRWTVGIIAVIIVALIAATAFIVATYVDANTGIHRSSIGGSGPAQNTGETNILIMGLDSRVDENGKPFPQAVYNQIHAEDASVGGYNTNVLMLIHIPANGGKAVGISIPRDDYVDFPGSPDGVRQGQDQGGLRRRHGRLDEEAHRQGRRRGGRLPAVPDGGPAEHDQDGVRVPRRCEDRPLRRGDDGRVLRGGAGGAARSRCA